MKNFLGLLLLLSLTGQPHAQASEATDTVSHPPLPTNPAIPPIHLSKTC